jgi:hypothetical protein
MTEFERLLDHWTARDYTVTFCRIGPLLCCQIRHNVRRGDLLSVSGDTYEEALKRASSAFSKAFI